MIRTLVLCRVVPPLTALSAYSIRHLRTHAGYGRGRRRVSLGGPCVPKSLPYPRTSTYIQLAPVWPYVLRRTTVPFTLEYANKVLPVSEQRSSSTTAQTSQLVGIGSRRTGGRGLVRTSLQEGGVTGHREIPFSGPSLATQLLR